MSEPIIIDGVDVSVCTYLYSLFVNVKEKGCLAESERNAKPTYCKNVSNCYYKQLQRLKADMLCIRALAQKLRTKTDYHSPDEVNVDIDSILDKTKEV